MTDFIIVGRGLAAIAMAHTLRKHKLDFKIIGLPFLSNSSYAAAGIWNPIVFKRLTKSWLADQTVTFLNQFYKSCEEATQTNFIKQRPLIRPFSEDQEKQLWLKKSRNELCDFLDSTVNSGLKADVKGCVMPEEYGIVKNAGSIDLKQFLTVSEILFKENLIHEEFDYKELNVAPDKVSYKNIRAKNIIFCEGHLVKNNPFFNWIPLKPVKGEVLTIHANGVELGDSILNKNGFIMQTSANNFKVGATYEWQDLTESATAKGRSELELKLKQLINCDYSIEAHEVGIRPSSIDRRPIAGSHPVFKNLFAFNGLGTKGVMLAPFFADNFVNCHLQKQALNPEVDIKRFYHLFINANQKT